MMQDSASCAECRQAARLVGVTERPPNIDPDEVEKLAMKLLKKAAEDAAPDHAACAQYLALIFKRLPQKTIDPGVRSSVVDDIRKELERERAKGGSGGA